MQFKWQFPSIPYFFKGCYNSQRAAGWRNFPNWRWTCQGSCGSNMYYVCTAKIFAEPANFRPGSIIKGAACLLISGYLLIGRCKTWSIWFINQFTCQLDPQFSYMVISMQCKNIVVIFGTSEFICPGCT